MRDYGPLPAQGQDDERLLTATEAGAFVHLCADRFKRLARRTPFLRENTIRRGNRAFWLRSTMRLYVRKLPRGQEPALPARRAS